MVNASTVLYPRMFIQVGSLASFWGRLEPKGHVNLSQFSIALLPSPLFIASVLASVSRGFPWVFLAGFRPRSLPSHSLTTVLYPRVFIQIGSLPFCWQGTPGPGCGPSQLAVRQAVPPKPPKPTAGAGFGSVAIGDAACRALWGQCEGFAMSAQRAWELWLGVVFHLLENMCLWVKALYGERQNRYMSVHPPQNGAIGSWPCVFVFYCPPVAFKGNP